MGLTACSDCEGESLNYGNGVCADCHGTGKESDAIEAVSRSLAGLDQDCRACGGSGKCRTCYGKGYLRE